MHRQVEIMVPVAFFITVLGIVYLILNARHKERMAMIERGLSPAFFEKGQSKTYKYKSLKYGLVSLGVGIGILAGHFLESLFLFSENIAYFSTVSLGAGTGLLLHYRKLKQVEKEQQSDPYLEDF